MSFIKDETKLSEINIPGTHDSGSFARMSSPGTELVAGSFYHCQSLDIKSQLGAGVRFLDLRGYANSGSKQIGVCHGDGDSHFDPRFDLWFDDILNDCVTFLSSHPSECIIILPKCDYRDQSDFNNAWEATYGIPGSHNYPWYKGSDFWPQMKDLRGKLFLLTRNAGITTSNGAFINTWNDSNITKGISYYIQDYYKCDANSLNNKVQQIEDCLITANNDLSKDHLILNFWSGVDANLLHAKGSPEAVANKVTPIVKTFLADKPKGRYGIQIMDFIYVEVSLKVVCFNYGNCVSILLI